MSPKTPISLVLIFIIVMSVAIGTNDVIAQKVVTPKKETVSIEVAKFAALRYSKRFYGEMQFYKSFTYYDLDEQPTVYAIVLTWLPDNLPSIDEINANISEEFSVIESLKETLKSIESQPLSDKEKYEEMESIRRQMREARHRLEHRSVFVTILSGATEGLLEKYLLIA